MKRNAAVPLLNPSKTYKIDKRNRTELTDDEQANWDIAFAMYDVEANGGVTMDRINPLGMKEKFWFYCEEHKRQVHTTMSTMVSRGFRHRPCKIQSLEMAAPHLKEFFKPDKDAATMSSLNRSSVVKREWECKSGHKWLASAKRMCDRTVHFCIACVSLKAKYPQLEHLFVKSDNGKRYDQILPTASFMCTWLCRAKLHEIKRPPCQVIFLKNYIPCRLCKNMKQANPELEKYYVKEVNELPYDQVLINGSIRVCWWCDEFKHKIWRSPYQFQNSSRRSCLECNLLSVLCPYLFNQLDREENERREIAYEKVRASSARLCWWKCLKDPSHKSWEAPVLYRFTGGKNCPECHTKRSCLEEEIDRLLSDRAIPFEKQKRFPDLRYKYPLKYDFFIGKIEGTKYPVIIEVDGPLHFGKNPTESVDYKRIKRRDRKKNVYAKTNNIHLLRLDYTVYRRYEAYLDDFLLQIRATDRPIQLFIGRCYNDEYREAAFDDPVVI